MDTVRGTVYGVVAIIAVTTVVSGPLVGAVDLTHERSAAFGTGTATVSVVEMPETITIEPGRFGEDSYYVRVAPATVVIENVTGRPFLVYKLSVDPLRYSRSTLHALDSETAGKFEATIEEDALNPETVPSPGSYDGTLTLILRSGHNETVVERRNVTVEVRE